MMRKLPEPSRLQRAAWPGILTLATLLGSLALACATPFPALAALAALFLPRRTAFALIGANWVLNQAIGFAFLNYPLNWDCVRGGLDLGAASLACMGAAILVQSAWRKYGSTLVLIASLVTAFAASELVLFMLGGARYSDDYSMPILVYLLSLNGISLAGLLLIQALGTAIGLARPAYQPLPERSSAAG
jgi:hypothetical protein